MNIEKDIMKWGKIKTEINKTCCIRKKPKKLFDFSSDYKKLFWFGKFVF